MSLNTPSSTPSAHSLAFLPLVYLIWADGNLAQAEIDLIRDQGLDALDDWLDPADPPTPHQLNELLADIRRYAARIPQADKLALPEFGRELARLQGGELAPASQQALRDLSEALGLPSSEATRRILGSVETAPDTLPPAVLGPDFSVTALARLLDGEQHPVRERLRGLLSRFEYRYGLDKDAYRQRVFDWCRQLAEAGIGALGYPKAYGGQGSPASAIAAFETLATHDLSLLVKFGVQFGLFGGSVLQLGTEKHHRAYLEKIGSLALPGCFAMTETGHGSNVYDIETVARYDRDSEEFVIDTPTDEARKDYIGNAALHGRMATVFAQLHVGDERFGVHALLVPIRDDSGAVRPGVRIEDCGEKLGLNGVDNGRLWFDKVRVPRDNLLDRFAQVAADGAYSSAISSQSKRFFTMLGTLVMGRISVALGALSVSKSALTIAVRYAERRRQFGPVGQKERPILDYLTHQRRLLPRLATTYALDFALKHLVQTYLNAPDDQTQAVEAMTAGLKAYSTWHTTDTVQTAREACGGQGYLAVNRLAALKADSDIFTTFEGDNTVLLQLLAKSLLSGYKQQFGNMNLLGIVRYLAGQAATSIRELNPIVTRATGSEHLRDRDFQLSALQWREQRLLGTVARRLKARLDDGMDSFQALTECQDHLLGTANAHVERLILERFAQAIGDLDDGPLVAVLDKLCNLYALSCIERDRGWFLQQGYIESAKAKAIRNEINSLCKELRPRAVPLVDAFAIPDALLSAPIALRQ